MALILRRSPVEPIYPPMGHNHDALRARILLSTTRAVSQAEAALADEDDGPIMAAHKFLTRTVEKHVENLLRKLHVENRTAAALEIVRDRQSI